MFQEDDLISAEVQNILSDGSLQLHTRSLKYGKLGQGLLVKVFPSLVKRSKTHFHNLPCGASIILGVYFEFFIVGLIFWSGFLGNNGYIWICPTNSEDPKGGFAQDLQMVIPKQDRVTLSRLRNCVLALAAVKMPLYDSSILYAYEESHKFTVRLGEICLLIYFMVSIIILSCCFLANYLIFLTNPSKKCYKNIFFYIFLTKH